MSEVAYPHLRYSSPTGRWAKLGPYYAMFPLEFAFDVINKYSSPGDMVLDPFAGRASSTFAAAALGRQGIGIEINPVGWLYGKVKLQPASKERVLKRIEKVGVYAKEVRITEIKEMPEFFHSCYTDNVLRYLLAARDCLKWQTNQADATLMAILLVSLHGKIENSFSNQMRQGKAMSPQYSINWWQKNNSLPPDVKPVDFLIKRVDWRYAKGIPQLSNGRVLKGDSLTLLKKLAKTNAEKCSLLFTSPPYYAVTDYHYDQWLRLWMLGGSALPSHLGGKSTGRFDSKIAYEELLRTVFTDSLKLMKPGGIVYVRTDHRDYTYQTTLTILKDVFNYDKIETILCPYHKKTQTALFGDADQKPGEVDIILHLKRKLEN